MPDSQRDSIVQNSRTTPLRVIFEPWGSEYLLSPREILRVQPRSSIAEIAPYDDYIIIFFDGDPTITDAADTVIRI